jgi:hypothetical protein
MATRPVDYNTDTELSSVNAILAAIGTAPITELNFANPEVSLAHGLLLECSIDVQSEGWVFNTENQYPFPPNQDDEIYIPKNITRLDVSDGQVYRDCDVVKRGDRLYNKLDHTFKFTKTLYCDVNWLFDFEDLPIVFQRYITYKAAGRAAAQLMMDKEQVQLLVSQESFARASCMEYECNQGDYTFFGTPPGTVYQPYQPYRTLAR